MLGLALVGVGLVVLLSGIALLMVVAVAGAALGGAIMAFRALTGRSLPRSPRPSATLPMEIEANYEILPPAPHRPGEDRGDAKDSIERS